MASIEKLLQQAYEDGASDLHITAGSPPVYRIHGELKYDGDMPLSSDETGKMAKELLTETQWKQFTDSGEFDFTCHLKSDMHFRVNTFRQRKSISIAARVIPTVIPSIKDLHMPDILQQLTLKPHGLILVTGPTGSGKSTTLAAMIDAINEQKKKHIITLEDPIEYTHKHKQSIIQQRELGVDTKSFANGLRAALRQDPDIILVGEMRDLETISTAITAAETGHLVLATLHTNSAAQTINRIIDVFPPHQQGQIRIQLASVLAGVISQRLFKRMDGKGRIAATEILLGTPAVRNLIRNEKIDQITNVLQTSKSQGMHTLHMSLHDLVASGKVSFEEAGTYFGNEGL